MDMRQYKYWMVHPCDATKAVDEFYDEQSKAKAFAYKLAEENPGRRFAVLELVSCFQVPIATEPVSLRVEHKPMPKTEDDE